MKLLGILWNSIGKRKLEAIDMIKEYASIEHCFEVDFKDQYENFIRELYPFNEREKWKAEYKINGLVNKYDSNKITILFLDMERTDKIYLKNKDKMMYKNVLDLKVRLRKKFKDCVVENIQKYDEKSYDNVFHMTDDEEEFNKDFFVVFKYLSNLSFRKNGFLMLDEYVNKNKIVSEKWGTRNKFWINKELLFKENSKDTYECYSEIFNMYLMKKCGLECAYYDLACYKSNEGIITWNVLKENEFLIDGSHMMSKDESFTKKQLIEHNSIECLSNLLPRWCNENNFNFDEKLLDDLEKLYIYDLLSLQPDRNPSNYAFAINQNTKNVRLVTFDNANMYFCDDRLAIQKYKTGEFNPIEYINHMKTFLLYKKNDTCFDSKIKLFIEYYNSVDNQKKQFIEFLLTQMNSENIQIIFEEIEKNYKFKLPLEFKKGILEGFSIYHQRLLMNLNSFKGKVKILK